MDSRNRINLEELSKKSPSKVYDFIDSISEDQAFDPDAEDDIVEISVAGTSCNKKRKRGAAVTNDELYFDSDDSLADPAFEPSLSKNASPEDDSSSDDNEPPDNFVPKKTLKISQQKGAPNDNFPWRKLPYLPHIFGAVSFEETPGPRILTSESPIEIFSSILGDDFLQAIVIESNRYTQQKKTTLGLTLEKWKAFIGMLFIMGFNSLPSIRLFWSSDKNFHNPRVSNVMPLKILRFLHLSDNEAMPEKADPNFDKLYKVRPMIFYLSNKFLIAYSPGRNLSVDESMVERKIVTKTDLGEKTVLELTKPFQNQLYCVYFDKF